MATRHEIVQVDLVNAGLEIFDHIGLGQIARLARRAVDKQVDASTALQKVLTGAADQHVAARAAIKLVAARAAIDQIVAGQTVDDIGLIAACQSISPVCAVSTGANCRSVMMFQNDLPA